GCAQASLAWALATRWVPAGPKPMIFPVETSDFGPILISEGPFGETAQRAAARRARRPKMAARRAALAIVIGAIAAVVLVRIVGAAVRPLVVSVQAGRDVRRLQGWLERQRQRQGRLL